MASVYADPKLRSKRTYIAVSSFNSNLYTYTTVQGPAPTFETTGTLAANASATTANCPRGHLLRENGARLYPGANPGVSTLMVGVYDADSGLRGYIDPNAPNFAVFNSDKPVEMVDGGDNNGATVHKGTPVYTTGDVIAGGNVSATDSATATRFITQNPVTLIQSGATALTADCSLGSVFYVVVNANNNFTINASNVTPGQHVTFILNATNAANTPTITGGTNIRESTSGQITITSGYQATQSFIGYSTYLVETSRIAAVNNA